MRSLKHRRIALWVEPRDGVPAVNPTMRCLLRELERRGATTTVVVPELQSVDPEGFPKEPRPDLVLLKTATTFGLTLASVAEEMGAIFLNDARSTIRAHDKAATVAALAAAGVPVPATYLVAAGAALDAPPDGAGRWLSKPVRGIHGAGVRTHDRFPTSLSADGGSASLDDDGTYLVQPHVGGDAADLKVYVAGSQLFAAAKLFSRTSFLSDPKERVALDGESEAVARAAGRALGLICYGVDLRRENGRPVVVDLNPFPGFRGFPDAVPALTRLIEDFVEVRS